MYLVCVTDKCRNIQVCNSALCRRDELHDQFGSGKLHKRGHASRHERRFWINPLEIAMINPFFNLDISCQLWSALVYIAFISVCGVAHRSKKWMHKAAVLSGTGLRPPATVAKPKTRFTLLLNLNLPKEKPTLWLW